MFSILYSKLNLLFTGVLFVHFIESIVNMKIPKKLKRQSRYVYISIFVYIDKYIHLGTLVLTNV